MWVQLRSVQHVSIKGEMKNFGPGDWVDVGRQTAMMWLASGEAWLPGETREKLMPADAGILLRGRLTDHGYLGDQFKAGGIAEWNGTLTFSRSLLWKPPAHLRMELIPVGMNLLEKWDAAVPLYSYNKLAGDIGKTDERRYTQEVIFDLRVPFYETGLMFIRRSTAGQDLLAEWAEEQSHYPDGDEKLAFLRAMFRVKPRLCALPTTWHDKTAIKGVPR